MLRVLFTFLALFLAATSPAWGHESLQDGGVNQTVGGQKQGHWLEKKSNGHTEEGDYANGKRNGIWTTRAADGTVRSEITFTNGIAKGPAKIYFADGTLMESGTWNVDHWEGGYARYNESGTKACDFTYNAKGRREGRQVYYHENGKVMYDGEWSDGKITGTVTMYDETGRKTGERKYDAAGNFCGSTTAAQADTGRQASPRPKNADANGNVTIFDSEGRKSQSGRFVDGKLIDGERFFYGKNGKLSRIDKVKNGKVVSHINK